MKAKFAKESLNTMSQMVLPNDTNTLNNLMGGRLLYMMDIAGAISAQLHASRIVVTASVDNVFFHNPIKLGSIVTITSKVTRAFNTSMEVYIEVWNREMPNGKKELSNKAYYTYVALDEKLVKTLVPELIPETEEEKKQYEGAIKRREQRISYNK